ncbi:MAG: hypothetical protein ACXWLG_01000 [Myxococcaceae bacterium]
MMTRLQLTALAVSVAAMTTRCAHDTEGHEVRTGAARFDAHSVTSPKAVITLESDGNWAQIGGNRYELVGDELRLIGGGSGRTGNVALIRPYASVRIDRLPNGLRYTPSYYSAPTWTFVTEDGKPLPPDLEIPLYFAARIGLGGQWVNIWQPARDDTGPHLEADCGLVLFELQGRQVAGWLVNRAATCPKPRYPGRDTLGRLIYTRNEVWVSPERPAP